MAFSSGRWSDGRNHSEFEKQRITWSYCIIYYLGLVQERSLYMTPPPQVLEQSDHWDHADHWPWTALGPCSPNLTHWPLRHHWRKQRNRVKEDVINSILMATHSLGWFLKPSLALSLNKYPAVKSSATNIRTHTDAAQLYHPCSHTHNISAYCLKGFGHSCPKWKFNRKINCFHILSCKNAMSLNDEGFI